MEHDPLLKEYASLNNEISSDPEIKSMGEDLVKAKKELALSMGTDKHKEKKEEYEALLMKIHNHPLLQNRDALTERVESELIAIRDSIK
ncbi:MAG: YlbF family regulator [Bacteroidales bacterium]|nr:YlbF family regulator [Bacteroidales bacterium]